MPPVLSLGFYTSHRLLKDHPSLHIHLYDRLPAPYGLVRYGVAPDHPDVKNVIHQFDKVAVDAARYSAVILSSGATAADNEFGVPGEPNLANIHSARAFVGWYNGLPEFANLPVDLEAGDTALVFGQGNVALDVARILLSPVDVLKGTDIAPHALEVLARSRVKHVKVIGRRGPLQVAFTAKELRELLALAPGVRFDMDAELLRNDVFVVVAGFPPVARQIPCLSSSPTRVGSAVVALNKLTVHPTSGRVSATATDTLETLPASLIVKSIGYQAKPIDTNVPFDTRTNTVAHDGGGKVTDTLYVAGWLKRGPTGVIASTMRDAYETAEVVLRGIDKLEGKGVDVGEVRRWVENEYGHRVVDWEAWLRVKEYEQAKLAGAKVVSVDKMLEIALK
ncbi:hypothetical protein BCR44DRAFT_1492797 [Catenaria anguillulae PL171]|uniref:adrenodoxin-NADP(+) reductase n=1 Tax=Catenaria anguillulae PL171 TaxID=765915 RepID=A0A1Y2HUU3_9FUNG|nr:hypothetical protein BCR44DRAFT_1492797 [Catenaria anguillulae PL171]